MQRKDSLGIPEEKQIQMGPMEYNRGERWNQFTHWDNLQIHIKQSWIGIEGLPINMWNVHVFKIIGKALGGLLEVAPGTRKFNFLRYAKIKVGGLEGSFMDPIMEILCEGLRVCIGMFPISNPRRHIEGESTARLVTGAVRAAIEVEVSGNGGSGKQKGIGTVNLLKPKHSIFALGSADHDDVVVSAEKADLTVAHKTDLVSARSNKEGGGKVAGLTIERISISSNEGGNDCHGESTKKDQLLLPNYSDYAKKTIAKKIV